MSEAKRARFLSAIGPMGGLALAALAACGRGPPRQAATKTTAPGSVPVPASAPGLHRRRLIFLSADPRTPVAAVLHFWATDDGDDIVHSAYFWLGRGIGWVPLSTYDWTGMPLREPGRIMPHGSLHLMLSDDGGIEALSYDSARTDVRIRAGETLGEWSRATDLRMTLRRAQLDVDGRRYAGALLIVEDERAAHDSAEAGAESGTEALLTDGKGYLLVAGRKDLPFMAIRIPLASTDSIRESGLTLSRADTMATDSAHQLRTWRVLSGDDSDLGELTTMGPGWNAVSRQPGFERFSAVRGAVQLDGRRRTLAGVIQRGPG
jgi:hypothetical protein